MPTLRRRRIGSPPAGPVRVGVDDVAVGGGRHRRVRSKRFGHVVVHESVDAGLNKAVERRGRGAAAHPRLTV